MAETDTNEEKQKNKIEFKPTAHYLALIHSTLHIFLLELRKALSSFCRKALILSANFSD